MSTRTTYTSTISVPVYASWKCEKCGELNFSDGVIHCQRQVSTSSFLTSKQREAKAFAAKLAQEEWLENAYKIISDPNKNAQNMRNSFSLRDTSCTRCNHKPRWDRNAKHDVWALFSMFGAVISGFAIADDVTSVVAWLIFLAFLGIIVACLAAEPYYKKMMAKLPKENTPVIGSQNRELVKYALQRGTSIPTPDESFGIVMAYAVLGNTDARPSSDTAHK